MKNSQKPLGGNLHIFSRHMKKMLMKRALYTRCRIFFRSSGRGKTANGRNRVILGI